jgi:hypothetical protein
VHLATFVCDRSASSGVHLVMEDTPTRHEPWKQTLPVRQSQNQSLCQCEGFIE